MAKIFILIGEDVDENLLPKFENQDVVIVRNWDEKTNPSTPDGFNPDVTIMFVHGQGEGELAEPIVSLQKEIGAKQFIVFSCYSGNLPDHLDEMVEGLNPDTLVTAFSSSKHPTSTQRNIYAIQEIIDSNAAETQIIPPEAIRHLSHKYSLTAKSILVSQGTEGSKYTIQQKFNANKHPQEYLEALGKKEEDRSEEEKSSLEHLSPETAMEEALSRAEYVRAQEWLRIATSGKARYQIQHLPRTESEFLFLAFKLLFAEIPGDRHMVNFEQLVQSVSGDSLPGTEQKLIDVLDQHNESLLHKAVKRGNIEPIEILLKNGADINSGIDESAGSFVKDGEDDGVLIITNTPLIVLLKDGTNNKLEISQMLLKRGANPNHQDDAGNNALHLSVLNSDTEITKVVLGSSEIQIDEKNSSGATPVQIAIENNKKEIAELIFERLPLIRQIEILSDQKLFKDRKPLGVSLLEKFLEKFEKEFAKSANQFTQEIGGKSKDLHDKSEKRSTLDSLTSINTALDIPDSHPGLKNAVSKVSQLSVNPNTTSKI
jgi:hypothetical protein